MNDAGMLTFDSQSGDHDGERAYVAAVMPHKRAKALALAIDLSSDAIALVLQPVPDKTPWETITVSRSVGPTRESETRAPLYQSSADYKNLVRDAMYGARKNDKNKNKSDTDTDTDTDIEGLVIVDCIDPKWGRFATKVKAGLYNVVLRCLRQV